MNDTPTHHFKPGLQLTFNPGPKGGASQGFVLGRIASSCDIVVPHPSISARHCYFTFSPKGDFIVQDLSSFESIVTYEGCGEEKRRRFTWILDDDDMPKRYTKMVIELHQFIKFQIVVSNRQIGSYVANINRFLQEAAIDVGLRLDAFPIQSEIPTAAQREVDTLSQDPIYIPFKIIDEGGFEIVTKMWDVSTETIYASKGFRNVRDFEWRQEAAMMKRVSHVGEYPLSFGTR